MDLEKMLNPPPPNLEDFTGQRRMYVSGASVESRYQRPRERSAGQGREQYYERVQLGVYRHHDKYLAMGMRKRKRMMLYVGPDLAAAVSARREWDENKASKSEKTVKHELVCRGVRKSWGKYIVRVRQGGKMVDLYRGTDMAAAIAARQGWEKVNGKGLK